MVEHVYNLSPSVYGRVLYDLHKGFSALLDPFCPFQSFYSVDCIRVHLDSSKLDDDNWKSIQMALGFLQSDLERLTNLMEYLNGKLND